MAYTQESGNESFLDRIPLPEALRALSVEDLKKVATELRTETVAVVARNGGHLGSGLGVIELTVALHAVFDTPRDHLIWDVGHQVYPHKILTKRRHLMHTLRQQGGLSGFTKRSESAFDPFGTAHAATSISAGLGFAVARDLNLPGDIKIGHVVCIIGDGSIGGGMALEALNHAGDIGNRLLVILNDNGMSISPTTGALYHYFERRKATIDKPVSGTSTPTCIFQELGFTSIGPIDGHDMDELYRVLTDFRDNETGPVFLHLRTVKGKGFEPAETSHDGGHARGSFDPTTGVQLKEINTKKSYTEIFGDTLIAVAQDDPRVCAVTAAMSAGTGLDRFQATYPDRFFDVGIAEQHAITFSAGLAAGGAKPFCAIYSTFLQRGFDQIIHDVALQKLPVRFAIDRAGLVGEDGATHAGTYDMMLMANLPHFVVMAASSGQELQRMVATAFHYEDGPCAFRYPRDFVSFDGQCLQPLEIGRGRFVRYGEEIALVSLGACLNACLEASNLLAPNGIKPTIVDARFAKPLDEIMLSELALHHRLILTIEEGAYGGFGANILRFLSERGLLRSGLDIRCLTLPDLFLGQGSRKEVYRLAHLDAASIAVRVTELLGFESRREHRLYFNRSKRSLGR